MGAAEDSSAIEMQYQTWSLYVWEKGWSKLKQAMGSTERGRKEEQWTKRAVEDEIRQQ